MHTISHCHSAFKIQERGKSLLKKPLHLWSIRSYIRYSHKSYMHALFLIQFSKYHFDTSFKLKTSKVLPIICKLLWTIMSYLGSFSHNFLLFFLLRRLVIHNFAYWRLCEANHYTTMHRSFELVNCLRWWFLIFYFQNIWDIYISAWVYRG